MNTRHPCQDRVDFKSQDGVEPSLGCWLETERRGFTHHGIYIGEGRVVHYAGLSRRLSRGPIRVASLAEFSLGHDVWIRLTPHARYTGEQAVARALSRIGEDLYHITKNNCEHFCAWCVEGQAHSQQVDHWLAWPHAVAHAFEAVSMQMFGAWRGAERVA